MQNNNIKEQVKKPLKKNKKGSITKLSNKNIIENKIKDVVDSIRFYINQDGGDLEYISYDDKKQIVTIKILGNCIGCSMIDYTYKNGLETILKSEIKEVKGIKILE